MQFLVEDNASPVVYLDPAKYELGGGGFATMAGAVLVALLLASLWYSWMWSGEQLASSAAGAHTLYFCFLSLV